jgi:hypothetical protein
LCGAVFNVQINCQDLQLTLDEASGLVKTVTKDGVQTRLEQNFYYYNGASDPENRMSGAYIFRPNGTGINAVSNRADVTVYKGKCYNWFTVETAINSNVRFKYIHILRFIILSFLWRNSPNRAYAASFWRFIDHTQTHHSR